MPLSSTWLLILSLAIVSCGPGTRDEASAHPLTFADLPETYVHGFDEIPAGVHAFSGQRVSMEGHLVLIDDDEAYLMRAYERIGCTTKMPGLEGRVRVALPEGHRGTADVRRARVVGVFTVGATMLDAYCLDLYQLRAEHLEFVE